MLDEETIMLLFLFKKKFKFRNIMINSRSQPHNEYLLSSIPTEEKEAVNSLR